MPLRYKKRTGRNMHVSALLGAQESLFSTPPTHSREKRTQAPRIGFSGRASETETHNIPQNPGVSVQWLACHWTRLYSSATSCLWEDSPTSASACLNTGADAASERL